jgi:hypothetical protein
MNADKSRRRTSSRVINPYYVVPKDEVQTKALSVMREALTRQTPKELEKSHLAVRSASRRLGARLDPRQKGLMLYLLRYEEELRNPKSALSGVKGASVDTNELSLAKQLIRGSTSKFDLAAYQNDCHAVVKKLIDAKRKGKSLAEPVSPPTKTKVVNIMDALPNGLSESKKPSKVFVSARNFDSGSAISPWAVVGLLARRNCLELPDAAVCAFLLVTLIEGMRIDKRWMLTDAATLYKLDAESASSARPGTVLVGAIPCRSDRRKKSITHESNSGITIPRRFLELSFESLRTMRMQRTCSRKSA